MEIGSNEMNLSSRVFSSKKKIGHTLFNWHTVQKMNSMFLDLQTDQKNLQKQMQVLYYIENEKYSKLSPLNDQTKYA